MAHKGAAGFYGDTKIIFGSEGCRLFEELSIREKFILILGFELESECNIKIDV